jgi:alpha-N-arabinofuranosidase
MKSTHANLVNPVLAGCYPDPSICRAGADYYLVCSSFAYYPGLPIFHSIDLVNWQQIGHALDRSEQLDLGGVGVSQGLFAPSICFYHGLFYIVCTLVDTVGNFVITAADPRGPWSNPVPLPGIIGFDPSLFFDDNGKAYVLYNSIPPGDIELHWGHRTIRINSFDEKELKVTSQDRILVNGGTDMAAKPIWIEAPHIIKKDGWYYLICAEGGTGFDHSEVVFRSRSMEEAFIPYDDNPVLTQRTLDPQRPFPITTAGHADFVETPDGKWFAVFLACRPYTGDHYNTGRETFLAPVEWIDGWPKINPGYDAIQYEYPMDGERIAQPVMLNGNQLIRDDFSAPALDGRFVFLRTVTSNWYHLDTDKKNLAISLQPTTVSDPGNPSFIGFRQMHLKGHAAVSLLFASRTPNEQAGLIVFQNEYHYYYLCISLLDNHPSIKLLQGPGNAAAGADPVLLEARRIKNGGAVELKIEANGATYSFYYALSPGNWMLLKKDVDASFLSTRTAGGFVGCMYAMYATSNGSETASTAVYHWFEILNDDEVYKR